MSNVTCPSGLTGQVRKLRVLEANLLADDTNRQKEEALESALRSCWLETHDAGPYTLKNGQLDWGSVLVADRFAVLLDLRIATYGTSYDFKVACEAPDCRKRFEWHIDLVNDLPRVFLPAASLATFTAGNRFDGHFDGAKRAFTFRLQDGRGERAVVKLLKAHRGRKLTVSLASRITDIVGVDPGDRLRFLDTLDMDDVVSALEQMDAVDGGVDTKKELQCEHCGESQEVSLPLGRDFWLPIRARPQSDSTSSLGG